MNATTITFTTMNAVSVMVGAPHPTQRVRQIVTCIDSVITVHIGFGSAVRALKARGVTAEAIQTALGAGLANECGWVKVPLAVTIDRDPRVQAPYTNIDDYGNPYNANA